VSAHANRLLAAAGMDWSSSLLHPSLQGRLKNLSETCFTGEPLNAASCRHSLNEGKQERRFLCLRKSGCLQRAFVRPDKKPFSAANLNGNERPEIVRQVQGTDEEREPDQLRLYAR